MSPIYKMAQNRLLTLPRKKGEVSFEARFQSEGILQADLERTRTFADFSRRNLHIRFRGQFGNSANITVYTAQSDGVWQITQFYDNYYFGNH